MGFGRKGRRVTLQGEGTLPLQLKEGKSGNWQNKVGLFVAQKGSLIKTSNPLPVKVSGLLEEFKDLFKEP